MLKHLGFLTKRLSVMQTSRRRLNVSVTRLCRIFAINCRGNNFTAGLRVCTHQARGSLRATVALANLLDLVARLVSARQVAVRRPLLVVRVLVDSMVQRS